MRKKEKDELFMLRALDLAAQSKPCVLPNPQVGAVIVRDDQILGEGFHLGPGTPHAEAVAIKNAKKNGHKNLRGSEIYISLEPCSHKKKRTPPCAPLLIKEGFKRVIIPHLDPNPQVCGDGVKKLKRAGIRVSLGVLEKEAILMDQAYIKNQTTGLPYVTMKLAMTFDGRMSDDLGVSKWITGKEARKEVQLIRLHTDSIAVGRHTVEKDDPSLNARPPHMKPVSRKVVIFGKPARLSRSSRVIKANGAKNIYVVCSDPAKKSPWNELPKRDCLKDTLKELYEYHGICHLLVEGGARLASSFLSEHLVDNAIFYLGKGILGGLGYNRLGNLWGLKTLGKSIRFTPENAELVGNDVRIQGYFNVYRPHKRNRKS